MIDAPTLAYLEQKGSKDAELASRCVLAVVELVTAITEGRMPSQDLFAAILSRFDSPEECTQTLQKLGINLNLLSTHLRPSAETVTSTTPGPVQVTEPDLAQAEQFDVPVEGTGLIAQPESEGHGDYPSF